MKKAISLFLCLQALFLFSIVPAFGEPIIIRGKTSTDIRVKSNYRNNPVIPGISSTTGLRSSGEEYTPIMVVLDNAEAAYPHWGVSQADIIFQVPNAGKGATKLLALFADFYPAQAGGVRSARATMLPLAVAWNAALAYRQLCCRKHKTGSTEARCTGYYERILNAYGLDFSTSRDIDFCIECLEEGAYLIACTGGSSSPIAPKGGHYFVLSAINSGYLYCMDSYCRDRYKYDRNHLIEIVEPGIIRVPVTRLKYLNLHGTMFIIWPDSPGTYSEQLYNQIILESRSQTAPSS